jgi:hypothetical protein
VLEEIYAKDGWKAGGDTVRRLAEDAADCDLVGYSMWWPSG